MRSRLLACIINAGCEQQSWKKEEITEGVKKVAWAPITGQKRILLTIFVAFYVLWFLCSSLRGYCSVISGVRNFMRFYMEY